jgi:hypothetical protein
MIRTLLTLAGVLSLTAPNVYAATAAPPQIAFIGDTLVYQWGQQPQFLAHSNWLPYGNAVDGFPGNANSGTAVVLTTLQGIIRSGKKPAAIFLIVGESNSEAVSPGNQHSNIFSYWAQGWEEIITTAQEAKMQVIVGTIPYSFIGDVADMNKWILTYCAVHNIPVVNDDFALNSGTGFAASGYGEVSPGQPLPPQVPVYYGPETVGQYGIPERTLTSQGWDLMTDMAEVAIGTATGAIKLKGGYLNTVVYANDEDQPSLLNANTVIDGGIVQFTAYGQYSDGSVHPFRNADINGHIGTWTNSNPLAMSLDQNGVGIGLDKGSTNVHFTTPSGATLYEWVMYTQIYDYGCGDCNTY